MTTQLLAAPMAGLMTVNEFYEFVELPAHWEQYPPTLIVDVLSPDDRPTTVYRRVGHFLAMGVSLVWGLDPEDSTLTVYQAHRPLVVLDAGDEMTGLEFLPDLKMKVADFFVTSGVAPSST